MSLNTLLTKIAKDLHVEESALPDVITSMEGEKGVKLLIFTVGMFDGEASSNMKLKVNVESSEFGDYIFGEDLLKEIIFSCSEEQDAYFKALSASVDKAMVASMLISMMKGEFPKEKN